MATGKVIGKVEVSLGNVKFVDTEGNLRDTGYEGLMYEGEQIYSDDPSALFQIKYSELPEATAYDGVFRVLADGSVISGLDGNENMFGDDIDFMDTAAGDAGAEGSSAFLEEVGVDEFNLLGFGRGVDEAGDGSDGDGGADQGDADPFNNQPDVLDVTVGNGTDVVYESSDADASDGTQNDVETTLTGTLTATDNDANDSHVFDTSALVVTSGDIDPAAISVTSFVLTNNEHGDDTPNSANFEIVGNFNALGAGESATLTFTYTATDDNPLINQPNESNTGTYTIVVTGTNDQPVVTAFSINDGEDIFESHDSEDIQGDIDTQADTTMTFTGVIDTVTDDDVNDTHTYEKVDGSVKINDVLVDQSMVEVEFNPTTQNWEYTISGDFNYLDKDDIATITFDYVAIDNSGVGSGDANNESSVSQPATITLTLTGTNDQPIVSEVQTVTQDEALDGVNTFGGRVFVTDDDADATHTFHVTNNATTVTETDESGNEIDLGITATVAMNPTTGEYEVVGDFNALALGERATVTFEYYAVDNNQMQADANNETSTSEPVLVTMIIEGTNDQPEISRVYINDKMEELGRGNTTLTGSLDTATDLDVSDADDITYQFVDNSVKVIIPNNNNYNWTSQEALEEIVIDSVVVNPNGTFSVVGDFNSLAEGESAKVIFRYTADDNQGADNSLSDSNKVVLIVTGTNDQPTFTEAITDNANEDDGYLSGFAGKTNLFTFVDDLDTTDTQSIAEVYDYATGTWVSDWQSSMFSQHDYIQIQTENGAIVRVYENGAYSYDTNDAFESLRTDATGQDSFKFKVTDDSGTATAISAESVVTIIVDGANDRPIAYNVTDTEIEGALTTYDGAENARYVGDFNFSDVDAGDTHTVNLHDIQLTPRYFDWNTHEWVLAEYAEMKIEGNATDIINIADTDINVLPDGQFEIINSHFNNLGVNDSVTITFKYNVTDNSGDWNDTSNGLFEGKSTVSITIQGTNDAPVVSEIAHGVTHEDAAAFDIALLDANHVSDVDTHDDLDVTNVTVTVSDGVAPVGGVVFSVDADTGLLTIDPDQFTYLAVGEHVDLVVNYDVDDGTVLVANTATVTVEGRNDIPMVSEIKVHTTEDSSVAVVSLLDNASDVDATDVLSIVDDSAMVYVKHGAAPDFNLPNDGVAYTIDYQTGTLTIDPAQFNYLQEHVHGHGAGSDQAGFVKIFVDFEVTDSNGGTVSNRAVLIVDGVNDVPVISVESYTTGIDTSNNVNEVETNQLSFDTSGDVSSMELQYFARNGFEATSSDSAHITIAGTVLNIDDNANYNDAFSFFLNDGESVSIEAGADIDATMYRYIDANTVVAVNPADAQVGGYYIVRVAQDDVARADYDLDIKIIGIDAANMPAVDNTTAEVEQNYMILDAQGEILDNVINPQEIAREGFNFVDADTISHVVTGAFGPSQSGENWNDAFKFSLTDGESANLSFVDNQTADSALSIYRFNEMTRVWETVPSAEGKGDYIVRVVSAIASVGGEYSLQIEVDASEANYTDVGFTKEDTAGELSASGHLRIEDPDMGEDFFTPIVDEEGLYGSLSMDNEGNWTYTLNNADPDTDAIGEGQRVTDTFEVWSMDGTASHFINITVEGTNDAAIIVADGATIAENTATVSGDANHTDVDSNNDADVFQVVAAGEASANGYGTYEVDASGVWVYTLDNTNPIVDALNPTSTPLTDTITVTAEDGTTKDVIITITGTNDAPTLTLYGSENLIINGSFENPDVATGTWAHFASIDGWTAEDQIEIWDNLGSFNPSDGEQHAELDYSGAVDTLSQTLNLDAGKFMLTFDAATRDAATKDNTFNVLWNGVIIAEITEQDMVGGDGSWNKFTFEVDAVDGQNTLTFAEASSDNYGPLLDNIQLYPELSAISFNETTTGKVAIGQAISDDVDDGAILTYSLDNDYGIFAISSEGAITIQDGVSLDYENDQSYELNVRVTDEYGASNIKTVDVNVNNVTGVVTTTVNSLVSQDFSNWDNEGWTWTWTLNGYEISGDWDTMKNELGKFDENAVVQREFVLGSDYANQEVTVEFDLNLNQRFGNWDSNDFVKITANDSTYSQYADNGDGTYHVVMQVIADDDGKVNMSLDSSTHGGDSWYEYWSLDDFEISDNHQALSFDTGGAVDVAELIDQANDFDLDNDGTINLNEIPNALDEIDLTQGNHNLSNITLEDVMSITDGDNVLKITGDAGDTVHDVGSNNWTTDGSTVVDSGTTYAVYTNTADTSGDVQLLIDIEIPIDQY